MLGSLCLGIWGLVGQESNFMGEAAHFFLYDLYLVIQLSRQLYTTSSKKQFLMI